MSAYALPGFFPPLESSFVFTPNKSFSLNDFEIGDNEQKVDFDAVLRKRTVSVSVTDTKVDSLRLIQNLTEKKSSSKAQQRRLLKLRRRSSEPDPTTSVYDAAMEFQLLIRCDGREFSVKRTLARMRQLRHELVRETEDRYTPEGYSVEIPALPRSIDDNGSLCFTLLQNALRCYAPVVETWFREVLLLVTDPEDSPSLSDFFFESDAVILVENAFLLGRKAAPMKLDSIEESEADEEEKED